MFATIVSGLLVILALFVLGARGYFKKQAKNLSAEAEEASTARTYSGETEKGRLEKAAKEASSAATAGLAAAIVLFVIVGGIMIAASSVIVEAKQVGVAKTFGKVHEQTLASGWHWKSPFTKVTEIDATTQTDKYKNDSAIQVKLKDGNTAEIYTTLRWSISEEKASQVYAEFRSDDPTKSLRDAMVSEQFKGAANAEFASFDPLSLAGVEGSEAPDYKALAKAIQERLEAETEGLVTVRSVTVSLIKLDKRSQKHLDDYVAQVAKTRTATEAQKTAAEQAKANEILSESISKDPNVLVARCLDLIESGDLKPPAGFSCWPGGGSGVVIPKAN